jgi:hypothetical protein
MQRKQGGPLLQAGGEKVLNKHDQPFASDILQSELSNLLYTPHTCL